MNVRMRRIDLFCKLMGPLTISLVTLASTEIAIWTTLGMNLASVLVEYIFIEQVYRRVHGLERAVENDAASRNTASDQRRTGSTLLCGILHQVLPVESLAFYFRHPAFLTSFALSLLYFTVLSFSGQMITYLVSVGYTPAYVGIARVGSSIFEISATWAAPLLMKKIGVVRAGSWSLAWQMACLASALSWYFSGHGGMGTNSIFSASGLAVGVALSRIGLWGFDLCAQNIIQDVSLIDQGRGRWQLLTLGIIGSRGRPQGHILGRRGVFSEPIRDALVRINHHLLSTRPVSVPCHHLRRGCLRGWRTVRLFLEETPWSPFPRATMHLRQGVTRKERLVVSHATCQKLERRSWASIERAWPILDGSTPACAHVYLDGSSSNSVLTENQYLSAALP